MTKEFPGMGVMIRMLCGGEDSVAAFKECVGKKITALCLLDDVLHFVMDDGTRMSMADRGQSCCETRYMMTDDNLQDFVGATLLKAEVRDAPDIQDEHEEHEVQFLLITTSVGTFTMTTHNIHNGYYGGFSIEAAFE